MYSQDRNLPKAVSDFTLHLYLIEHCSQDGVSSPASSIRSQDLSILTSTTEIELYDHSPSSPTKNITSDNVNGIVPTQVYSTTYQSVPLAQEVISVSLNDGMHQSSIDTFSEFTSQVKYIFNTPYSCTDALLGSIPRIVFSGIHPSFSISKSTIST